MISPTLDAFRQRMAITAPPPVVVFNKSHSGSRMLARYLGSSGICMGSHLNESWDSLDVLELVEYLVTRYYPDYSPLWDPRRPVDAELTTLLDRVFTRHRADGPAGARWGWKLCETTYILPVIDYCFPHARFVHLIRDGRDVAFSDHKGPTDPFWRKVYFNTDRVRTFAGLRLTPQAYRRESHVFNALHWMNSVSVGRAFGAMLRERYLEVRYENLCGDFPTAIQPLIDFLGLDAGRTPPAADIRTSSIGKYRQHRRRQIAQVVRIEKPLLLALGYLDDDQEPGRRAPWRSARADWLVDRWRRRTRLRWFTGRTPT